MTDETKDRDEEFDLFAKSAADSLRRPAPSGGAASVAKTGERKRTRQRVALAAGGAAVIILAVSVLLLGKDDTTATVDSTPSPTTSPLATNAAATPSTSTESATTSAAPSTSASSTTASTPPPPDVLTLAELPVPTPIETVAEAIVQAPASPAYIGAGAGSLWSGDNVTGDGLRFSFADGSVEARIPDAYDQFTLAIGRPVFGFGSMWYLRNGTVVRVDAATNSIVASVLVPGQTQEFSPDGSGWLTDIVADDRGIWTLSHVGGDEAAIRIDPATNEIADRINVGESPRSLSIGAGSLWISHAVDGKYIARIDPNDGHELARIELGFEPGTLMANNDTVWVLGQVDPGKPSQGAWRAARIDAKSNSLVADLEIAPTDAGNIGFSIADLVVTDSSAWFTTNTGVVRVDAATNRVSAVFSNSNGGGITTDGTSIWTSHTKNSTLYRLPVDP